MIKNVNLHIAEAEEKDAEAILEYLKIVGAESDHLLFDGRGLPISIEDEMKLIAVLKQSKTSCMLVGKIEEEIVAVASMQASTNPRIAHHSEIAISVKKDFWGRGVGRDLMKALITYAAKTKIVKILHLKVKADNQRAIELYRKLGFKEIGRFPEFFKINGQHHDAILMNGSIEAVAHE